ncbi:Strongly-conserved Zn-finger binding protein (TFIIIA) [Trapelia coarctata]|nr:Strongly-conserved Zn-finger binding protein (TFIIIA) [Trapelia coarctata]
MLPCKHMSLPSMRAKPPIPALKSGRMEFLVGPDSTPLTNGTPTWAEFTVRIDTFQSEDATQSMQPSPVNGGLGFPTYAALQVHNKMTHPRKCEECGYKTSYPNELTHHIEIQHGGQHITERATHHCREPGCGRSFTRNGNLLIHLKTAHAKGKAYVCGSIDISNLNHIDIANWSGSDACGHGFTSKQSLEDHIRFVHMGVERPRKEQKKKKRNKDKPQRSGKSKASALSRLAGTAYDEDTSRTIACFRLDCPQRFSREYDLEMHMQSAHDLADFEIQLLRAARDGIGPASYGYSLASERTAEDLEAERALDEMFGSTRLKGVEEALEEAAERGGQFWVGGRANDDRNMNGDDWGREERELRNLIDEDGNEVDEALEEAAHRGGQFWVGGSAYADDPISGNDDWEMEEAELRQLIDEDEGGAGEMMIDPMLR